MHKGCLRACAALLLCLSPALAGCAFFRGLFGGRSDDAGLLTTALDDASTAVSFLDGDAPAAFAPLWAQPRTAEGGYQLFAPGAYAMDAKSYCVHAGTHGPGGDGYLYAPLRGSRAGLVRSVIRNASLHPEITQQDAQMLLWAALSRTGLSRLPEPLRKAADALLDPGDLRQLREEEAGEVAGRVLTEALETLSPQARELIQTEERLRDALGRADASYEEVKGIAVRGGNPEPGPGSKAIPPGRWSLHPRGYLVRFLPASFLLTRVEVVLPQRFAIARDARGRIAALSARDGQELLFDWREPAPGAPAALHQLRGFTLRRPPAFALDALPPAAASVKLQALVPARALADGGGPDVSARVAAVRAQHDEVAALEAALAVTPPDDAGDLDDLAHLRLVLRAAPASAAQAAAAAVVTSAWQFALCARVGRCSARDGRLASLGAMSGFAGGFDGGADGGGGTVVDLPGDAAVPGNTSRQRIAPSNDPASDQSKKTQCERARRAIDSWSNFQKGYDTLLPDAKKNGWSHGQYDDEVGKWASKHAAPDGSGGVGANPIGASTNMCTCQTTGLPDFCRYLASIGAPKALCDAATAHEKAHQDQCQANKSAHPPLWHCDDQDHVLDMTPDQIDRDEHEAYDKALDLARKWYDANCR